MLTTNYPLLVLIIAAIVVIVVVFILMRLFKFNLSRRAERRLETSGSIVFIVSSKV